MRDAVRHAVAGVKTVQRVDAVDRCRMHEQEADGLAGALRFAERLLEAVHDRIPDLLEHFLGCGVLGHD
jgi:hypothetical protein